MNVELEFGFGLGEGKVVAYLLFEESDEGQLVSAARKQRKREEGRKGSWTEQDGNEDETNLRICGLVGDPPPKKRRIRLVLIGM